MKQLIVLLVLLGMCNWSYGKLIARSAEIIIKIKKEVKDTKTIDKIHKRIGAFSRTPFRLFTSFQIIRLPSDISVSEGLKYYDDNPYIEYAEPNYIYSILNTADDPLFKEQWALDNQGQQNGVAGADIDAIKAWEVAEYKKEIVVAVIDTGVDYNHEDLKNVMWKNEGEIPGNKIDDDGNGFIDDIHGYNFYDKNGDPMDDNMHGTHCAGIIAADHNKKGIRGVAPKAKVMAVRFLGPWGDGTLENGILAIEYALLNGANILSNSWGGPPYSKALDEVIGKVKEKGLLFVAAAGNDHSNNDSEPTYPASYDHSNIISVAASNSKDFIAKFSNWGLEKTHLTAPGRNIISTILGNKYKLASGTSMAAPYVSGAAAVLWAHFPEMDYLHVKKRLMDTVDRQYIFEEKTKSGGRLNLYNALMDIRMPPLPPDTRWTEVNYDLESPHDYPSLANLTWKIQHPGAKAIRVHFKRFETEKRMDYVGLKNSRGENIESLTGNQGSLWSREIPGDTVILNLRSDSINQFFGFVIDKYKYY